MAFEKAKVIKAAEKFLSQGKINAAIKEYRQIIKHDDGDLTTLNMLGDLLARAGENEEAASCFLRIAEHFREQEFRLKAIAMYRKVDKLKPRDPAIAKELGDLYSAQGLIADARTQYLVVADAYTRAGQTKNTLKVLHRIADLDPNNTDIRLKLGEGYLKEQMLAEAARAFSEAATRLLENGQFEKALGAYTKALELRPNDRNALKGLVAAHTALGSAEDAAEILETAVKETPDDPELVAMLAQAYIDADDAPGAERATALLMKEDASNYRHYIDVARVYLKVDQQDDAARILGVIIEPMLAGREENDLLELVDELLARNPEHVPSLRLLARIHWWQRDMEKLRGTLERLAEAAEAAGLVEEERYALTQLVRLAPDEQHFIDRLNLLGGVLEETPDGSHLMDDPALATVPSFDSFSLGEPVAETAAQPQPPVTEFEWNSVAEDAPARESMSFADLNEAEGLRVDALESGGHIVTESVDTIIETSAGVPVKQEPKPASVDAMMRQELDSVDFYITQGYSDIAFDTLELLERQFGSHPEIDARRKKLEAATQSPGSEMSFDIAAPAMVDSGMSPQVDSAMDLAFGEIEIEELPPPPPSPPVPTAPVGKGIDSGLAEIFEEFRMEAEGESASSHEDYETHYNMATAYKEMDLLDEAIREFQVAAGLTGSADGTPRYFHCCNMLGHCFVQKGMPQAAVTWFKKGLDGPGRNAEESKALQYELGSAYEQMGDLTRAVAAFTEVYGVDIGYRDIGERLESLKDRTAHKKKKGK
ncbi:MAG TPA: tetratricopeptide repeat protein [Pyrinomonadaceae bacterium]|jgi:tetratricopeptide (TPR) repeat protein|nr:tetratricopeptide repeat protein [Pyrinomonadaceae bacterium]